jgi:hypothetical protein
MSGRSCRQWWAGLDSHDKQRVYEWLAKHPPPLSWAEGKIAYAFTEMASAPRGSR